MAVFAKARLLPNKHLHKSLAMFVFLQLLEHRLLRFGHGAPDTMPLPLEFAHIDTGTRCLGHEHPLIGSERHFGR